MPGQTVDLLGQHSQVNGGPVPLKEILACAATLDPKPKSHFDHDDDHVT